MASTKLKWSWTYGTRESAHTPFGSYFVERSGEGFKWGWHFAEYYDEGDAACDSLDEGKVAAQVDWEERTGAMFAEAMAEATPPTAPSMTPTTHPATGDEALRLVVAYDDLLRRYEGPSTNLFAGDVAAIDEAYDKMVAACRAALTTPEDQQ